MVALWVMWFIALTGWKQGSYELFDDDDTSHYTFGGEGNVVKRSAQIPANCEAIVGKIRMDGLSTNTERDLQTSPTSLADVNTEKHHARIGLRLDGTCDPSSRQKHWSDGSDVNFENWLEGEPSSQQCIENSTIMYPNGKWVDYSDNRSIFFICETENIVYCPQHVI